MTDVFSEVSDGLLVLLLVSSATFSISFTVICPSFFFLTMLIQLGSDAELESCLLNLEASSFFTLADAEDCVDSFFAFSVSISFAGDWTEIVEV